jgi:signal transduction histidine kinase
LGDRLLQLSIEDNGVGFDAAGVQTGLGASRFGMTIVRDRPTLVGGELAVQSAPGRGTALSGRVPVYDDGKLGEGPKTQEIEISIPNQVRESDRAGQLS